MSFIGEAAVSALLEALSDKLISYGLELAVTNKQVRQEIEKWGRKLRRIRAVLADAEEKQMQNRRVKVWLAELKELAYDVDDILDQFTTKALQLQHQASTSKSPNCLLFGTICHSCNVIFNNKMMSKMKEITEKLVDLAKDKDDLQLVENANAARMMPKRPESSSVVDVNEIYGREEDKQKILDLVKSNDGSNGGVAVIPIVGMGGIGKTTLAQLVYNDHSIQDHFDLKKWVCVSDQFDIKQITKTILLSVASEPCDQDDLDSLQRKLEQKLSKKKFLLVLDDVWNENYEYWTDLRRPFHAGAPGSKIIATTRSSKVSSIMRSSVSDHSLKQLSDDVSISILALHALGEGDFSGYPYLEEIGRKIIKKCNGLPLAIKVVGGLLRGELDREAWKGILGSKIWDPAYNSSPLTPALWLSYYHLSSQLKQCFAYCSLIPKDFEFKQEEIVLLWKAEGFLHEKDTDVPSELALGRKCFEELVSRSLFEKSSRNRSKFVMHDLINDLARSVAGDFFSRTEGDGQLKFAGPTRHTSYIIGELDGLKRFEKLSEAKHLRTFLPFRMMYRTCYISNKVLTDLLPKLKRLRVLSLERYYITEIPECIGELIHLCYLNFSYTMIKGLPNFICNLYNLECLILRFCKRLKELPSRIGSLVKLCHLDIRGATSIREMPSGIDKFTVGEEDGSEMQNSSNLRGELCISNLQNLDEKLSQLEIRSYIKDVIIEECDGLEKLPETFRNLMCLKELHIRRCHQLVSIPVDSLPPTLRTLTVEDCGNLECLLDDGENINFSSTSLLEFLGAVRCGSLKSVSTSGKSPAALKSLDMRDCQSLQVIAEEFGDNMCLQNILLYRCGIEYLPKGMDNLHYVEYIKIDACRKLVCLPDWTANFKSLYLSNCTQLEALPSLHSLQLENLRIYNCPGVKSIPEGGLPTTLSSLKIWEPKIVKALIMEWGGVAYTHLSRRSPYLWQQLHRYGVVSTVTTAGDDE